MHLLIAGVHTRPAVASAKRLDYRVTAVDYFGDADLRFLADSSRTVVKQEAFKSNGKIEENYSDKALISLAENIDSDITVLTSTMKLNKKNIAGNRPEDIKNLKNKAYQFKKLKSLGVKFPETEFVSSKDKALEIIGNFGFPCILKPASGAGGRNIIFVRSEENIPEISEEYLIQRFIPGTPLSISTLSTGEESIVISSSFQILGYKLSNTSDFVYCGSIVPYKVTDEVETLAEEISLKLKLIGWNGIDFVESRGEFYFMEVNPRFQGTFDAIEKAYSINLVEAHLKACEDELIDRPLTKRFAVRLTLFSPHRSLVKRNLLGITHDVPLKNSILEKREPFTTIVESGRSRDEAIAAAREKAKVAYSCLEPI